MESLRGLRLVFERVPGGDHIDFNDRILENAVDLFTALAENYETHLWRR